MSKRFIDTGFMDQKWIRKLSPEKKIFVIYLMLKCDNAGIIDLDIDDAEFWIGKKIGEVNFLPENYLIPINGGNKYFMPKFIEWQYSDLSSSKHIVAQARQLLEKYNLINDDFTLNLSNIYINVTNDLHKDYVTGIGIGNSKGNGIGKRSTEFDLKFVSPDWSELFNNWVKYKKSRNENYKTQQSLEACYRLLLKLSTEDINIGKLIIDQSMGNNWAGLFPLKKEMQFKDERNTSKKYL